MKRKTYKVPRKITKKRQYKEHNHQKALFDLAAMYETQQPELKLMTGSMNGVPLTPQQARRAKQAGLKAGFPDVFLPVARGRWFGLYIEMKTNEGSASPDQLRVAQMLRAEGYAVEFIRGSARAWELVQAYLRYPKLIIRKEENLSDEEEKTAPQLPQDGSQIPMQIPEGPPPGGPGIGLPVDQRGTGGNLPQNRQRGENWEAHRRHK